MVSDCDNKDEIYEYLKRKSECCYINDIYLSVKSKFVNNSYNRKLVFIKINILFFISVILSAILLLANLIYEKKYNYNKEIAIARVLREKSKIMNVFQSIQIVEDDVKNYDFSIYRIGKRKDRMKFLLRYYLKFCIRDFYEIKKIFNNKLLAPFAPVYLIRCAKRIPHTVIYKNSIEHIMVNYNLPNIYIGAVYERFALIAESLSKKYKKKLICIPHGVESTEKMPRGYVGDVFYCSSLEMALKLNELYATSKFIFNEDVTRKMYSVKKLNKNTEIKKVKKLVFFTQPRDTESTKKIINSIAKYLKTKNQKLYVKVHPLESSSDYEIENIEIINDFREAIIGNICISFASTVMVEALYNKSVSISIIYLVKGVIELKGDNEFLNDQRILKPKDQISMFKMIEKFI